MPMLDDIKSPADLRRLPLESLDNLAAEIRAAIIDQVAGSGGHLAPNLGVVELTLALHYVFDFSHDRLLFDVGHQCYPHKLITGRAHLLEGLRTRQGMAGFPEPAESAYDLFAVGHAGTAISTAVGMARGDTLNQEAWDPKRNTDGRRVVSLIGDASIVNGVAMEGLNNAGTLKRQFLVVLNDNGMSIAKPQGALAGVFDRMRISSAYSSTKRAAHRVLDHLPGGKSVEEAYHRLSEATKHFAAENTWFEHFGLVTIGPIDGHDIRTLVEFLEEAKDVDRPLVLHVKTTKGKGLDYAEKDATTFHSPAAHTYDPKSCRVELASKGRSFTAAFADALTDLMERDESIVSATAAMPGGTGLDKVAERFPDRTFDTGICESHAMDMMAGLAKTGRRPFFAVYSTFLQRAFDQAFQEVSLQGLGVRLCLDRAGFVGGDGAVHHGFCDIALLAPLPGAVLTAAMDEPSLNAALDFMRTLDNNLSAVRYPRDTVSDRALDTDRFGECPPFELGKARPLITHDQPDAAILAYGTTAITAIDAADAAAPEIRADVYDARFAKPVDEQRIADLLRRNIPILTVEDHAEQGGFGQRVIATAQRLNLDTRPIRIAAMPDHYIRQASRAEQLTEAGLDTNAITRALRELCAAHPAPHASRAAPQSDPKPAPKHPAQHDR